MDTIDFTIQHNAVDDKPPVCADPGRSMWYGYIGQYFGKAFGAKGLLPIGSQCPLCGARDIPLEPGSGDAGRCQAQSAITAKRAGRKEGDPAGPLETPRDGMTSFGDGAVTVAGPHARWAVTNLFLTKKPPADLVPECTAKGSTGRILRRLIDEPPKPPFVVVQFSKKGNFPIIPTVDTSLIHINGENHLAVDRERVAHLRKALEGYPTAQLSALFGLRARFATGVFGEGEGKALQELHAHYPSVGKIFPDLPTSSESEAKFLKILLKD